MALAIAKERRGRHAGSPREIAGAGVGPGPLSVHEYSRRRLGTELLGTPLLRRKVHEIGNALYRGDTNWKFGGSLSSRSADLARSQIDCRRGHQAQRTPSRPFRGSNAADQLPRAQSARAATTIAAGT